MDNWIVIISSTRVLDLISQCLQMINPGRILKFRVRGTKRDLTQGSSSEEVCVVMPGVIARFDGADLQVYILFYAVKLWDFFNETSSCSKPSYIFVLALQLLKLVRFKWIGFSYWWGSETKPWEKRLFFSFTMRIISLVIFISFLKQ